MPKATADDVEKLRKIVAMFGSEHDGEILAAVRRMTAHLAKLGLPPEAIVGLSAEPQRTAEIYQWTGPQRGPAPKQKAPDTAQSARPTNNDWQRASEQTSTLEQQLGPNAPIGDACDFAAKILRTKASFLPQSVKFLRELVTERKTYVTESQQRYLRDLARQALNHLRKQHANDMRNWQ